MADPVTATTSPTTASLGSVIPYSDWIPRRTFVFVGLVILTVVWTITAAKGGGQWPVASAFMMLAFVYVCAPSAEQAVRMFTSLAALKAGVTLASSASAETDAGRATSTATAAPDPNK